MTEFENLKDSNISNILTERVSSLEKHLSHLKNVNDELVSENTELHTLAENLKSSEDKLKEENSQLHHVIQDLSDTSRQIEDELEARQNEMEALKNDLHGKNEDILTLHNELEDKENEMKRMKDKHQKTEFAQQRSVTNLQKQMNKMKLENKGYKEQITELTSVSDAQNTEGMGKDSLSATDKDESTVCMAIQTEEGVDVFDKQVLTCDMNTQTMDMEDTIQECSKLKELESKIADLMDIIAEQERVSLSTETESQMKDLYEAEIKSMKQEIDEKEGLILESMDTINILQEKLKEYEAFKWTSEEYLKELEVLQDTVGSLEQQNTELKHRLKVQEEDLNQLYDELEDKTEALAKVENSKKLKNGELSITTNDINEDIKCVLRDKDRQIEEMQEKVRNYN